MKSIQLPKKDNTPVTIPYRPDQLPRIKELTKRGVIVYTLVWTGHNLCFIEGKDCRKQFDDIQEFYWACRAVFTKFTDKKITRFLMTGTQSRIDE